IAIIIKTCKPGEAANNTAMPPSEYKNLDPTHMRSHSFTLSLYLDFALLVPGNWNSCKNFRKNIICASSFDFCVGCNDEAMRKYERCDVFDIVGSDEGTAFDGGGSL